MTEPLSILFGSTARVKLLRFFLFNPSREFTFDDMCKRAKLVRRTARTEISALERAEVITKRTMYTTAIGRDGKEKKTKVLGYGLNKKFPELQALQTFLFETAPVDGKTLLNHLRKAGTIDFLCVAGGFVREIELEIRFAVMTSDDLLYRVGMNDKLARDVFDYKHQIIVDKIGVRDELHTGSYKG